MQQLDDREGPCDFKTIGGECNKLSRMPSLLAIPDKQKRSQSGKRGLASTSSDEMAELENTSRGSSSSSPSSAPGINHTNSSVLRWDEADLQAFLTELGLQEYEVRLVAQLKPEVAILLHTFLMYLM